jgi:Tfp pilus assembly protein PilW
VELLVVVVVSLIVTGVAFSVYRLNASYYYKEDAFLQQYQNLRVALYTIGRDVRMAGNGMSIVGNSKLIQIYSPTRELLTGSTPPTSTYTTPAWFVHPYTGAPTGVRAIYGVDGGAANSDSLTVFRAEIESGTQLAKVVSQSGNSLTIDEVAPDGSILRGDIIAVSNSSGAIVLEVDDSYDPTSTTIPIKASGRYTPPSLSSVFAFEGAYLYNFRDVTFVTYYVDQDTNSLMADYHDNSRTAFDDTARKSFVVANNIEDLQVYFFSILDGVVSGVDVGVDMTKISLTRPISIANLDKDVPEPIKAVAIGMTSISPYGDGPYNRFRPSLFNRKAGTTRDNRIRSTLVQTINLRNCLITNKK